MKRRVFLKAVAASAGAAALTSPTEAGPEPRRFATESGDVTMEKELSREEKLVGADASAEVAPFAMRLSSRA